MWLAAGVTLAAAVGALTFRPGRGAGGTASPPLAVTAPSPRVDRVAPAFDAQRSWRDLIHQVEFGPRVPGSAGHRACRDWLLASLRERADDAQLQGFSARLDSRTLAMSNVIARWKGREPGAPGVLLCAHWDTRPTADEDPDPRKRNLPIAGANDGASGVAVLLELARMLQRQQPRVPVMVVLFDGEDYGPGLDRMFLGSRHFAANLPPDVPRRGILLDMVGDRDLRIPQELYSLQRARQVVDEVYAIARRLGRQKEFPAVPGQAVLDDHIPLLNKGLQVIDLIDFDYGPGNSWWHTHEDTPDKCSPNSLAAVGEVVAEWVYSR